jgi:ABC-type multidrug transport system fused ATPase/permease subunit
VNTIIFGKAAVDLVYNDIKEIEELEKKNAKLREEAGKNGSEVVFEDSIKAEGVSFRYEEATTDVFSGVNLEIKKGHSTAFIGPSGGGKTTMVDILLGLLDPTEGKVTVDGRNIKDTKSYWYKHLGYIPQNIYLTDDTIRKNVAFGIDEKEIDDKKVWQALEEAQLDDFVKGLPDGLDTKVGERGSRISGGQRQRIGIARALYRNPEVLVFDEATSALDTETEKEVMKAVDSLHGSKTIIMIAHRLSTIENCDEVYRIEGGKVEKTKDF